MIQKIQRDIWEINNYIDLCKMHKIHDELL